MNIKNKKQAQVKKKAKRGIGVGRTGWTSIIVSIGFFIYAVSENTTPAWGLFLFSAIITFVCVSVEEEARSGGTSRRRRSSGASGYLDSFDCDDYDSGSCCDSGGSDCDCGE